MPNTAIITSKYNQKTYANKKWGYALACNVGRCCPTSLHPYRLPEHITNPKQSGWADSRHLMDL